LIKCCQIASDTLIREREEIEVPDSVDDNSTPSEEANKTNQLIVIAITVAVVVVIVVAIVLVVCLVKNKKSKSDYTGM
jgi:heme/copper-type cytochrome/quinol oxidase subunit 2